MKVVSGETMQLMDQRAIREFGIPGLSLMEKAGKGCAEAICERFGSGEGKTALIVAGKGNNGGDGFVIARHLRDRGWHAPVLVLSDPTQIKGDASHNLLLLKGQEVLFSPGDLSAGRGLFPGATLIVDALLGTGLKSDVGGLYAEAIELINGARVPVVSVDIPSGIDANTGKILKSAVRAVLTVTFALAKLGNVQYPGRELCGDLLVADIGMPGQVVAEAPGGEFVTLDAARSIHRPRSVCAHKGGSGHTLVAAGSTGKTGAAAMSAGSAVRSGGGLVTLAVPASLNRILEVKTTEAMTLAVADAGRGFLPAGALPALLGAAGGKDGVALGPGIGQAPSTGYLVKRLVEELLPPLVLDADALNALSGQPEILLKRKGRVTILTPHPGEMARLIGRSTADVEKDRIATAVDFSTRYGVHLVLKGAATVSTAPDGSFAINGSGNPGMASGGMGDVLTGVILSLVGQGYPPYDACRLGVFLHGLAADLSAGKGQGVGMTATDVQELLPLALTEIAG